MTVRDDLRVVSTTLVRTCNKDKALLIDNPNDKYESIIYSKLLVRKKVMVKLEKLITTKKK